MLVRLFFKCGDGPMTDCFCGGSVVVVCGMSVWRARVYEDGEYAKACVSCFCALVIK